MTCKKKSTVDGKYLIRYLLVLCAGKLAGGVLEVKMIIVLIPEEASVFGTDRGLLYLTAKFLTSCSQAHTLTRLDQIHVTVGVTGY